MTIRHAFRFAAPVLALALMLGCSDASLENALPTLTEPGFYPLLTTQAATSGTSRVDLSLKQVPGSVELASVQGEITYDAAALRLSRATLPEGMEGDAEEVSPGRVRFVGTMVQGSADTPLLHLEFTGRATPKAEMFSVRFEEVTGGSDVADLTPSVRSDRLLFVRAR